MEKNKTWRIANRDKRIVLIASIAFPPLGYWLLGKRKYSVLCLLTFFYVFLGFIIVPVHTRILVNRARKIVDDEVEQKSHHRIYGECPSCSEQMLRVSGPLSVVCESCGERYSQKDVERQGLIQSLTSSESDEGQVELPDFDGVDTTEQADITETASKTPEVEGSEISERVDRIEGESKPAYGIGAGLSLMALGSLISITGIGAIIGIPMLGIGLIIVVIGVIGQTGKTAKKSMSDSVWKGTELEEVTPGVVRHRKVNKKFGGRCVVCGEFASLRERSGKGVSDEVQCKNCGARLEREESDGWRLVEGDDERIGERKKTDQWKDELRERELKETN
ncbi:hypothetical protein [Haloplanus halophilus]|uniref:hypothetical protein n=1 Tax=Haloplanus halophilus TaxID=2949993 RepID=UPI00203CAEC7|nr:hypothetical protein [Haloplanus sp. GDY1]